jgi:single-strand DNA-binding protein
MSTITVAGNVTREPDLKYTPSGMAVVNFSVAVNTRKKKGDGYEDRTSFYDCVAFQEMAEQIGECVDKGTRLIVQGKMEQDFWEDKETGQKRSKWQLVCDEVGASMRWATVQVTRVERKGAE